MNRRNKVVYIPYPDRNSDSNGYSINMVHILKRRYNVLEKMAEPTEFLDILETKAVFLNWWEDRLNEKMKKNLLWHKRLGVKIIWVFHNKYPHNIKKNKTIIDNITWLADNSTIILVHSVHSIKFIPNINRNEKKAVYVPHVKYDIRKKMLFIGYEEEKYKVSEDDFVFIMFGFISPYKRFEDAIDSFNKLKLKNAKLLIVGKPCDERYAEKLVKKCRGNGNIILDLHYLTDYELNEILSISDVVIIPYTNESSMNSGVMIQAFSCGKTVIATDFAMARDYAKEGFFYGYRKSLDKAMKKAYENGKKVNRYMGERAKNYMDIYNSKEIVGEILYKLLG